MLSMFLSQIHCKVSVQASVSVFYQLINADMDTLIFLTPLMCEYAYARRPAHTAHCSPVSVHYHNTVPVITSDAASCWGLCS